MRALAVFCLATVLFLVPRDLLFAETRDVEVWLGFEVRGTSALATAPVHWAIFLVGAWGFWFRRPWILPCAAGYRFYVLLGDLIWTEPSRNRHGWPTGLTQVLAISVPSVLHLRICHLRMREVSAE